MSMISTPSLAPGARTLPIGLRDPHGNAHGWHRLHGNMAPLTEHPIPVDPRIALSGLGFCAIDPVSGDLLDASTGGACTDTSGAGVYVDPTTVLPQLSQIPTESPYPVVITTQGPNGTTQTQSMTPAQLTALINAGSASLQKIIALTQGGSVLANGSIIGSQQAAQLAAAQSGLNISTAGLSGVLSNPILLLGIGAIVLLMATRK